MYDVRLGQQFLSLLCGNREITLQNQRCDFLTMSESGGQLAKRDSIDVP